MHRVLVKTVGKLWANGAYSSVFFGFSFGMCRSVGFMPKQTTDNQSACPHLVCQFNSFAWWLPTLSTVPISTTTSNKYLLLIGHRENQP